MLLTDAYVSKYLLMNQKIHFNAITVCVNFTKEDF